ncbi:MAG: DeoR family transcriptional regulator [Candidatus Gracilibacteria bacterium]|nr:DeoR family transcriptional regulator [Candidatus Gracilibacteria bacterium]MDD3120270.1 DeoR family transcriptional regulator [Candidatus Gracilibacteria bacterium]MDD4530277.1 DeoR family transcriptional regulator [Candidatus Gracilibacteria bacterium]
MKKIDVRKVHILKLIIEEYIKTGDVTGSKSLLKKHDLSVSSATIRNDMNFLEKMGLIFQPYNSAGRLPTCKGIRVFVDYLMEGMPGYFIEAEKELEKMEENNKVEDRLYLLVSNLTKATGEVAFGCIPGEKKSYYLGLSNLLQSNGFLLGESVCSIIKVLEDKYNFIKLLENLNISNKISVFIGEENIIPDLESCTIIAKKVELEGKISYIGILGSLRMDYVFNIAALKRIF